MQPLCLADLIGYLVTTLMFGAIGYSIAHNSRSAPSLLAAILIVLGTMFAGYFGNNVAVVSIFGFTIYLNHLLQGIGFGLILGFMTRKPEKTSSA